jgi:hypothetical protein
MHRHMTRSRPERARHILFFGFYICVIGLLFAPCKAQQKRAEATSVPETASKTLFANVLVHTNT